MNPLLMRGDTMKAMRKMMSRKAKAFGAAGVAIATLAAAVLFEVPGSAQQDPGTFRLLTFEAGASGARLGTTRGNGDQDIVDVHNAVLYLLKSGAPEAKSVQYIPVDMRSLIEAGAPSINAVKAVHQAITSLRTSGKFVEPGGLHRVFHAPEAVRYLPPITNPSKIFGLAGNYIRRSPEGKPGAYDMAEYPSAFLKPPSSMIGHDQEINLEGLLTTGVHEPEFAIIVGKTATNVPAAQAMDYVMGYTILNDVSSRDLPAGQHSSQGSTMSKGLDTFAPTGPYITLKEDVPNPHNLAIGGVVNGRPWTIPNPNTSFLTFTVAEHIVYLSERVTLVPGDIIATGVPAPVMTFQEGDLVELTIGNLGTLRSRVVSKPVPGHKNFPARAVAPVAIR